MMSSPAINDMMSSPAINDMMSSPAINDMMSSPAINEDMILEIMSCCPLVEIGKFRVLNKECNKRSYEMCFINRHLHRSRTNSVFGYFFQFQSNYWLHYQYHSRFLSGIEEAPEKTGISLEFIPRGHLRIEACDTRHGVLLCVNDDNFYRQTERIPVYIICKPTTKQYRTIPNPEYPFLTAATGLMVIQSKNPFRYKIVKVSKLTLEERKTKTKKKGFYNLHCEVFDSDTFAWKRLNDLEFRHRGGFATEKSNNPVWAYGFLHWLTSDSNVIRFCLRTETWSLFPIPEDLVGNCIVLVSYQGKLGVVCLDFPEKNDEDDLWVLESSFGKSWVHVKDAKISGGGVDKYVEPLWYPSNDVVAKAGYDLSGYKSQYVNMLMTRGWYSRYNLESFYCFPFYSNYERVDFE